MRPSTHRWSRTCLAYALISCDSASFRVLRTHGGSVCEEMCRLPAPASGITRASVGDVGGGADVVGGGVGSGEGGRDIRRIREGSEGEVREEEMREVAAREAEGREVVRVHDLNSLAGAVCAGTVIAAAAAKIGSACALAPQTVAVLLAGHSITGLHY